MHGTISFPSHVLGLWIKDYRLINYLARMGLNYSKNLIILKLHTLYRFGNYCFCHTFLLAVYSILVSAVKCSQKNIFYNNRDHFGGRNEIKTYSMLHFLPTAAV